MKQTDMKYTKDIKIINSEVDIREKFFNDLIQERTIDQTALYLDAGVDRYYNPNAAFLKDYDYHKITQLLANALVKKKTQNTAIISLGCGSCETDKIVLERLQELGHNFSFFGVDSSLGMIRKANDVLYDATFDAHLICGNFGASRFKDELDEITENYDVKIYMFFGSTLANLDQGYISDTLRDMLRPGDYLLVDIGGFETITSLTKLKLFERYSKYIDNPSEAEFFLGPLKDHGFSDDCGRLILKITTDYTTQAQVFTFKFKVEKPVEFYLKRKKICLTPNEHISVCRVLIYDLSELIKFFRYKDFEIKEELHGNYNNQLLFEKQ